MAKTKFPSENTDDVFRRMFGVGAVEEDDSPVSDASVSPVPAQITRIPPATDFRNSGRKKGIEHVGQKFYITKEQEAALHRRAYLDDRLDRSGHVRAALESYLAEDLNVIRSGNK